ncbi:hypothetical protein, partial [uncultured Eudoraea sp.]|uniref:hypothetical protein n=1 Tax=uncultured Eudoraea sp. TaxID=1035614 RepID=UPI002627E027
ITSDYWDRGDFGLNGHLPYFDSNSLQLAQADSGDKENGASGDSPKEGEYTQEQINEMMNNPLGELWMLFVQNDTTWYDGDALDFLGEDKKIFNTTTIMPVMAMQLTEDVKYIFRPVIPIHYWDAPSVSRGNAQYPGGDLPFTVDFERETELGDIVLWNAFATNEMAKPPNIYGVGVTLMLDTATEDVFGTGKNSAGPMALAFHIGEPGGWILGTVVQHWWDFSGDDDRQDVNMTNIQYVAFYRLTAETNIGFGGPNITINHEADSGQKVTFPVGLGWNTTTKIGPLPVKIGVELYKYIESPDNFGADYGMRLIFSPVVPSPAFSKIPIF